MTKVIVKRSQWLHGEGSDNSKLFRTADEKMCCLGYACLALGVPKEKIVDRSSPSEAFGPHPDFTSLPFDTQQRVKRLLMLQSFHYDNGQVTVDLMRTNDDPGPGLAEFEGMREVDIIRLGRKVDLDFEFVD